jgi:aminoglycoside phosphotransferase (APT) family kinase protein
VPDEAELRHSQLIDILHDEYGHLSITSLRKIGAGMDGMVYCAHSRELGHVAIKTPHSRWMTSGNEPRLDTRTLLCQELQLSQHLRAHGLPVPEVFSLHTSDTGPDFIISQFIESDGSELPAAAFGQLIRAIHDAPLPPISLIAGGPSADPDEVLAERIPRRLKVLISITDLDTGIPDIATALSASRTDGTRQCLLHMDLRPENILARAGRPAAILDWSNALTGDPRLDLARSAEYGCLSAATLTAYGNPEAFSMTPSTPREIIYRLDTAIMLAHVFLNGAPDEVKAKHYMQRTQNLCRTLQTSNL